MSNEELIAQARELCERKIAEWQEVFDEVSKYDDAQHQRDEINSWTTHLAEMDEHHVGTNEGENHCWKDLDEYPCDFLVTNAKRVLGATND